MRRRDQEKHVNQMTEARQQVAAGLGGFEREAVEAETVNQQMGNLSAVGLLRHETVELMVDDLEFDTGQGTGIFIGRAERIVIKQVFAPDIRTDQGEIGPTRPITLEDRKSTRLNSS